MTYYIVIDPREWVWVKQEMLADPDSAVRDCVFDPPRENGAVGIFEGAEIHLAKFSLSAC